MTDFRVKLVGDVGHGRAMSPKYWDSINDLALIDAIRKHVREQDGGFSGEAHSRFNSHLIGAARVLGMTDEQIDDAIISDRQLTIYEP